jgi:hypothetical protein
MNREQFVAQLAHLCPASTFLTLRGYRNESSEIADYSIAFHISYASALRKSREILEALPLTSEIEKLAREELVESFTSSLARILDQNIEDMEDGYTRFFDEEGNYIKGVKLHQATDTLYLYGLVVHKRVIIPGMYPPPTNRRKLTIAKDKLRYLTPVGKFRQFKITPSQVDSITVDKLSLLPPHELF